jgi:YCII-related domain
MKRFLVLYKSSTPADEIMAASTPEQMQAGMAEWQRWATKAGDAIVDFGTPLGDSASVGDGSNAGTGAHITGFSILQAESLEAVATLLRDHPHLKTPGESSITVLEALSMPGM